MKNKFKDKVKAIGEIESDLKYLKQEYERFTLWGSQQGDVEFESLMEWLIENQYNVEHMISVGLKIKGLEK